MGFRTIAGGIIAISILTFIATKYYSMNNEIHTLKSENTALMLEISQSKQNVDKLTEAIKVSNAAIENLKITNSKLSEEYNNWKNKPPEVKYKDRIVKEVVTVYKDKNMATDCKAALDLLNKISTLQYNNL